MNINLQIPLHIILICNEFIVEKKNTEIETFWLHRFCIQTQYHTPAASHPHSTQSQTPTMARVHCAKLLESCYNPTHSLCLEYII